MLLPGAVVRSIRVQTLGVPGLNNYRSNFLYILKLSFMFCVLWYRVTNCKEIERKRKKNVFLSETTMIYDALLHVEC